MTEPAILAHLENVRPAGAGKWTACCPCHTSDSKSSLSITLDGGKTLLHDFGGCETEDILTTLGLGWSILFDGDGSPRPPRPPQPEGERLGILLACACGAEYLRLQGGIREGLVVCAAGHPAPAAHAAEIARQVNIIRSAAAAVRRRDAAYRAEVQQ